MILSSVEVWADLGGWSFQASPWGMRIHTEVMWAAKPARSSTKAQQTPGGDALGTSGSLPTSVLMSVPTSVFLFFFSELKTFSPCFLLASDIPKAESGPSWKKRRHLSLADPAIICQLHICSTGIWFKKQVLCLGRVSNL